jgi:tricorn protease
MRGEGGDSKIVALDLTDDDLEEKTVVDGAGRFDISADGKQLLYPKRGAGFIQPASPGGMKKAKKIVTDGMVVLIDPREEWEQIFVDAWRRYRNFFYDPTMHGVDWKAVRGQYAEMLDDCVTRSDVGFVIREMISELNVGHAYYRGTRPMDPPPRMSVGMLGVDFELHEGAYRIAEILRGGPWDTDALSPLDEPGVDVSEGDYVLAVNGQPVDASKDPWASFQGMAGKTVELTVNSEPEIDDEARHVVVDLLRSEVPVRYRAWVESNRRYVEEKSDGKIGYVYVPDTGVRGQNELVRQYFGQVRKEALLIDERWNGGGQIPTRFIEMLNRPVTNYWARRHGKDWPWPPDAHHGPKAMLINGLAGSGGDAFPFYFKQAGLGPLIGTRTWGGLVGIGGLPPLVDGAGVTVPSFAFYEKDGTWGIEGHGVDPDIEVLADPAEMVDGSDPQLDAAIEYLLQQVAQNPYEPPERPDYPDRSGWGIEPENR